MSEELTVSKIRLHLSYDSSEVSAEMISPASEAVHQETNSTPISTAEMRKKRKKANASRHDETKMYNAIADTIRPLGTVITRVNEPSSPSKKGTAPQFSVNVRYGQTAGWIKMALGMKVGLGQGDFVLDGDPALPRQKGGTAPNFGPTSIHAKRLDGSRCHLLRR